MLTSDPDPIGMAPWIRIWIRIEMKSWIRIRTETNADSQHCFFPENFKRLSVQNIENYDTSDTNEKDKTI